MDNTKVCQQCKQMFTRPLDRSNAQWHSRRFCSPSCQNQSRRKPRETRHCPVCNTDFQVLASSTQKFCSRPCAAKGMTYVTNPSWLHTPTMKLKTEQGKKRYQELHYTPTYSICERCGEQVITSPGHPRRFCSRYCKDRWWSEWRQETVLCLYCQKPFRRSRIHQTNKNKKFCSRACYLKHLRTQVGENNSNWRGGPCYYGPRWGEYVEQARERDQVCQGCGKTPEQNGVALDVHHIVPIREFNGDWEGANQLSNLKCLCKQCHRKYQEREY